VTNGELLDQFLRDVTPTIEELVTKALQQGRSVEQMALLLERAIDGSLRGGCGSRREMVAKLGLDPRFTTEQRAAIVNTINDAGTDIPAVLLVQRGEGEILVGLRRLPGSLVEVS
jgi:hypothetical protein